MTWPFGDLPPLGFDLILADPATRFETRSTAGEGKSPQAQYETMTWDELDEGADLFSTLWNAPVPRVACENPVMHRYAKERSRFFPGIARQMAIQWGPLLTMRNAA